MIIYCDGACSRKDDAILIGYGVIVHANDETHELCGKYQLSRKFSGMHEVIAFTEAMLFVESHQVDISTVSVYTDDEFISYAHHMLCKANYCARHQNMLQKISCLDEIYGHSIHQRVINWLNVVRVNWVKGHRQCIDNMRADYLARNQVNQRSDMCFANWIKNGFSSYPVDDVWFPPFVMS